MRSRLVESPPQIAPKPRNSAFLENKRGSKKTTSKISERYSLGVYALWRAEGLPPIGRVSAVVRMFYFLPFRGLQRRFDATCRRLPVWGRIGKTRQIAFVARCRNANGFILKRGRICSRPLSCLAYHQNNGRWHIQPKSTMSMPMHG